LATENLALDKPTPLNPIGKRNLKNLCEYHIDPGHDTNSCWQLWKQIEHAIQSGHLAHLVKEIKTGKQLEDMQPKPSKDVNIIVGSSSRLPAPKRQSDHMASWMEQEISFPPIQGGAFHTGPVIVTTLVDDHRVGSVLLDKVSSSEIMYEHCFEQLVEEVQA
jgi:hypothetical protein